MRRLPLIFLAACSGSAAPPAKAPAPIAAAPAAPTPAAKPAPTPPELRLPTNVRPVRNTVDLTLDPTKEDFTGSITTELAIAQPTDVIWLNGNEIAIAKATVGEQVATVAYPSKDLHRADVRQAAAGGHRDDADRVQRQGPRR